MHMEYQNNWVIINNYRECIDSEAKIVQLIFFLVGILIHSNTQYYCSE